jgi:hypothetical protein
MPYEGEILDLCGMLKLDFRHAFAVVVSGARWNPCGHLILNTGGRCGIYCHIAERKGYPRYMNERGFMTYLSTNGKREIRRDVVLLPEPEKSYAKLEQLMAQVWSWWILPHNCATFVEDVLQAGGTKAGLYSNCPSHERFQ